MNIDDLRRLSFHDVGNWPMLPKALVLGAIFFAAYVFSPRYGLVHRFAKARHFHEESLARWQHEDQGRGGH